MLLDKILALLALNLALIISADLLNYDNSPAYDSGQLGSYPNQTFRSSELTAPRFNVLKRRPNPPRGLFTLLGLQGNKIEDGGPMILDSHHHMVWFKPGPYQTSNLQVQQYNGQAYLTYWSGHDDEGHHGKGAYHMLDSSYEEVLTVPSSSVWGSESVTQHECMITKTGTALYVVFEKRKMDLSSLNGGLKTAWTWDCVFKEIDLSSRKILFHWRASSVVPLNHSTTSMTGSKLGSHQEPWDWFHLNSIDKDDTGNYLISARSTNSLYYISGKDGSIIWILGGVANQFSDVSQGKAISFASQGNAKWQGDNMISLFDNGSGSGHRQAVSRGMLLSIDSNINPKIARLVEEFPHPEQLAAASQGSIQVLSTSSNVLVGWGHIPSWTEYDRNGSVTEDIRFGPASEFNTGNIASSRVYKAPWRGFPKTRPSLVIHGSAAYVSWNGATEVNHWMLQSIRSTWFAKGTDWVDVVVEQRQGFETVLNFEAGQMKKWIRVVAFSTEGKVLGLTKPVEWRFARRPYAKALNLKSSDSLVYPAILSLIALIFVVRFLRRCCRRAVARRAANRRRNKGSLQL